MQNNNLIIIKTLHCTLICHCCSVAVNW